MQFTWKIVDAWIRAMIYNCLKMLKFTKLQKMNKKGEQNENIELTQSSTNLLEQQKTPERLFNVQKVIVFLSIIILSGSTCNFLQHKL